ncbi:hypothetical protein OIU84_004690 [Salix udensis]|uniref:Uncharacterized protein n=1 Tax=Salix udensis TaxID=889485 RepID=A0AAD6P4P9_9ROSI|nr:hypothetical protein OIU84_004690 [Salix udensis]
MSADRSGVFYLVNRNRGTTEGSKIISVSNSIHSSTTVAHCLTINNNLPVVSNRIPYTQVLILKENNKLKHVIKAPNASLKQRPEAVLVVLDDNQVLRTVLPSLESNRRFWDSWDEFKIDALCVNAYTPPVKRPELPKSYLGFLGESSGVYAVEGKA